MHDVEVTDRASCLVMGLERCRKDAKRSRDQMAGMLAESELKRVRAQMQAEAISKEKLSQVNRLEEELQRKDAELADLRVSHALLRGEMPAVRQQDRRKLEELMRTLNGAQERVRRHLDDVRSEEHICKICFTDEADALLNPCGHLVLCMACARRVAECPACRANVEGLTKVFR